MYEMSISMAVASRCSLFKPWYTGKELFMLDTIMFSISFKTFFNFERIQGTNVNIRRKGCSETELYKISEAQYALQYFEGVINLHLGSTSLLVFIKL